MEAPGFFGFSHDSAKWSDDVSEYVDRLRSEEVTFKSKMRQVFPNITDGNDMISTIGFHMKASPLVEQIDEPVIDVPNLDKLFELPLVKELNESYFGGMTSVTDKKFNVMRIVNLFKKPSCGTLNVNRRYNNITMKVSPNRSLHFTGCCNLDDVLCLAEYGRRLTSLLTNVSSDTEWCIADLGLSNVNTCSMKITEAHDIDRMAISERLSSTDAFDLSVDQKKDESKRQHHALKCKIPITKYSGKTKTEFKKYSKRQPSIFIYKTGRMTILHQSFIGMETVLDFVNNHILTS